MLKQGVNVSEKNGLHYITEYNGRKVRLKPWLADAFSFLYDFIMTNSVFPRKFEADMAVHYDILRKELEDVHGKRVLELACGSGSAIHFLPADNLYTGTDISRGLIRKAVKRFRDSGFSDPEFFLVEAGKLPFADVSFDICFCILSMAIGDGS